MENFNTWLIKKGYTTKIIKDFLSRIQRFDTWLVQQHLTYYTFTYPRLLAYIGVLQAQGKSKNSINTTLRTLEHYYNYLNQVSSAAEIPNVALNVRQRGITTEQPLLLTAEELDHIYHHYQEPNNFGHFRQTNKILIGLMAYQAIFPPEIYKLEIGDLNLEKGTLYVPAGSRRKNSRTLALQAHQIIPLQHYITQHRAVPHPLQHDDPSHSTKLFSPNCDKKHRLDDQLKILSKTLKQQYPNLKNLRQLNQSRISQWITQYGLRKTQYLSGYKAINAIERYKEMDMKDLTKQIQMFHPLQ